MTIPIHWLTFSDEPTGPGVYWDTGMFEDLVAGKLWRVPTGHEFEHHIGLPPAGEGAVLVLPGRACVGDQIDELNQLIAQMPWCLLYVTSDEERQFPLHRLARLPKLQVWLAYAREDDIKAGAEPQPLGYRPGTRELLAAMPQNNRPERFAFLGQITHERRREMAEVLDHLTQGYLLPTEGFSQGIDQEHYLMMLRLAQVAPAPSGPLHVDSFRLYEALEAGCWPVPETHTPTTDMTLFWDQVFRTRPWAALDSWADLPRLIDSIGTRERVMARAWWQGQKRWMAEELDIVVSELTDDWRGSEPRGLEDRITVLISSSPIPSHPSTAILDETIASVRSRPELADAEIIIMLDGVRPEQQDRAEDYYAYVDEVCRKANHEWTNVLPIVMPDHCHQARMTRDVLVGSGIATDLVLFLEHDTPLAGDIPFADLIKPLDCGDLNLIRLYHENTVPPAHTHLMLEADPIMVSGLPVIRTAQWSQRPSLVSLDYYRDLLDTYVGDDSRTMVEDLAHGIVQYAWNERGMAGWEEHRLAIYAPPGGYQRSDHLDGRAGDPKFDMIYEYPGGGTPEGAPRAMSERTE